MKTQYHFKQQYHVKHQFSVSSNRNLTFQSTFFSLEVYTSNLLVFSSTFPQIKIVTLTCLSVTGYCTNVILFNIFSRKTEQSDSVSNLTLLTYSLCLRLKFKTNLTKVYYCTVNLYKIHWHWYTVPYFISLLQSFNVISYCKNA